MMMRSKADIRHTIGGKWLLESRTLAIVIPFLLATSILSALSQRTSLGYEVESQAEVLLKLLLANLVAFLACWAVVELANRTVLKSKATAGTRLPVVLVISFAIGVTKGFVTGLMAFGFDVFNTFEEAIGLKWLQTGILGMLLIPALALLAYGMERVRHKSELLLAERVQSLLGRVDLDQSIASDLLARFKVEALRQIERLEKGLRANSGNAEFVSAGVRALIDAHVRPLSHSIAHERQRVVLRLDLEWGIRAIFGGPVLGFLLAYLIIFVTLFMGYLQVDEMIMAFSQALITAVVVGILCSSFLVLRPRHLTTAILLLVCITATSSFLGIAISESLYPSKNPIDGISLGLVVWLLVLQNILSVVLSVVIWRQNRLLDDELEELFAQADLDVRARSVVQEITNRNLAQYFHSDVQNKLLSTALILEAQSDQSPSESIEKLREVIESLDGKSQSDSKYSWKSLEQTITEHWSGFIDVSFELEPALRKSLTKPNSLIFEILMEALSNALRHGKASHVTIELTVSQLDSQQLQIRVIDDGLGPKAGRRGLGSDLFEGASRGNWSLNALPGGGSLLVCSIPIG